MNGFLKTWYRKKELYVYIFLNVNIYILIWQECIFRTERYANRTYDEHN